MCLCSHVQFLQDEYFFPSQLCVELDFMLRFAALGSMPRGSLHLPSPCFVAQNMDLSQASWPRSSTVVLSRVAASRC